MSTPTQVIKFAEIHNESVGSLGAQALGEWEGLPFFHVQRSAFSVHGSCTADTPACVELDQE